ncbi:DUF6048 family protein [Aureisphaera galaxeae]|uniref:DUF6048 family protein n=1 Tax=Aureisphaera galaxeae TaxID=1538023 RepID=UPI0023506E2A|nr:DUF6048 family protein [Aureisphaera galaxeae]MDC8004410.1 DUF6048 family protein [Aureisphaera galaxeae]
MRSKHILLFFISLWLGSSSLMAQTTSADTDSIPKRIEKYGIRVGADLSKLARTAFEDGYTGFEVMGDLRFSKKFFAAAEIGNETRDWDEENLTATAKGSYIKLGADYNAYNNWLGMDNAIYAGLRYGFATFSQELTSYGIFTTDITFPTEIVNTSQETTGLTASWAEFIFGVKTEIFNNLYLSINLQLKRKISEDKPDNFDNLIIPGFNRTYDSSQFGVGYGYGISYLIPILKR